MIGKIIGAVIGGKMAEQTKGIGGTTGALLGAAAPVVLKRLSIPAMIVIGAGGYFAKKHFDKSENSTKSKGAKKTGSAARSKSDKSKSPKAKKTKSKSPKTETKVKNASKTSGNDNAKGDTMPKPAQKTAPVASTPQPATA